ncbi:MAG: M48 family metallopeptidase [Crocinitomicaceae bacterium]|nr:M48 family metalloprotease [Crocinitomicaceae bacterium]
MKLRSTAIIGMIFMLVACGTGKEGTDKPDGGFNLFPVEKDKELGLQVAGQIESNPSEYPILDSASNVAAYKYIYKVRDKILATGEVKHKDDFAWRVRIVNDDETLNAFCTPGGYIYFYTGIIKYLDNEAQLAGVMGHEMGHADLRHSTRQMTKQFGVQLLLSAVLGDQSAIGQITAGLLALKFSRAHETEADQMSVYYLCPTDWPADGGAGFFEKIEASGAQQPPQWLSTHPSPENRIENFHNLAKEKGCGGRNSFDKEYEAFKALF